MKSGYLESCAEEIPNFDYGFFCTVRPYGDVQVLKEYRGLMDHGEAERLRGMHDDFVRKIRSIGIKIPSTTMRSCVCDNGKFCAVVIQSRFRRDELAREIVKLDYSDRAIEVAGAVVGDAVRFLSSDLVGNYGFHPTINNYASRDGVAYYLDTFPPYKTEAQTKKVMIEHAPSMILRFSMRIGFPFLGLYTEEYYRAFPMLRGILGTLCRLRPELRNDFLDMFRNLVGSSDLPDRDEVIGRLESFNTHKMIRYYAIKRLKLPTKNNL